VNEIKPILDEINSPDDLRRLDSADLPRLADELRDLIITTVAQNGGHLASNLGTVELTIALHRQFISPDDKIVWDVGHQSYTHKILTGRRAAFATLRTGGGLSGYPKRSESPHDVFETGHSSTSISAALGLAQARDRLGGQEHIAAVIGDGAMTAGLAFEALNHAGHSGTRLIVVLNDNEMSISENVGALSSYLGRLRSDPAYFRLKSDVEYLLRRIPAVGDRVAKVVERVKDSLKYLLVAGVFFEELGFTYLGPVDGHNFASLNSVLQAAKRVNGPVLIHVLTQKGKGYPPAERNPDRFHGVGPFQVATGEFRKKSSPPSYTSVFGKTLTELAAADQRIVAITAAMLSGTGLEDFNARFPDRCYDVGIAEQHAVTFAAGLAAGGLKPVVAIYSTFMQRAFDQVIHDVCLPNLPVVFAVDRSGVVGEDGETHQGVFDLSFLRQIPNLTLLAPKDENELRHMLKTALSLNGPVAVRYPRGEGVGAVMDAELEVLPPGQAEIITPGREINLWAAGAAVPAAQAAAALLAKEGSNVGVVNARFVKPLDAALLVKQAAAGKIITVEDNAAAGGFGSAVGECLIQHGLGQALLRSIALPDKFIEHGPRAAVLARYGISGPGIAAAVRTALTAANAEQPQKAVVAQTAAKEER
jgi:1-deoxy-D-xylulose-5-phosphate synthase